MNSQLPEGWEEKRLGEICENLDSKRIPITKAKRVSGDIPYYGASGIVDYVADYIFNEDLLLISEDGANLLARTYPIAFSVSGKTWINNHAHVLRFNHRESQQFVEYFFNSISLEPYLSGMAQPKLNQKSLNSIPVPLPSLPEQKRIVALLDKAFKRINQAIANAEKNLANARELFESYLNDVFTRKGEGWEEKKLGEIGKVSMCKRVLKKQTTPCGDIPFYKIGTFGKKANAFITQELYHELKNKYSFPQKGQILLSASGTIGRRVRYDGKPAFFQDSNIVWIDNNESLVSNDYLYFFYDVCDWNPSKGATIKRLYNNDLRAIQTPFPPLPEQERIVGLFDKMNQETKKLQAIYQQKLNSLQELKQSILQKAFSGNLDTSAIQQASP